MERGSLTLKVRYSRALCVNLWYSGTRVWPPTYHNPIFLRRVLMRAVSGPRVAARQARAEDRGARARGVCERRSDGAAHLRRRRQRIHAEVSYLCSLLSTPHTMHAIHIYARSIEQHSILGC